VGAPTETKTTVDGALLPSPNFAAFRSATAGQTESFLFKEILFSGGYSALYGEAMSSALMWKRMICRISLPRHCIFFPNT
jgi:hypothetical protein